MSQPITFDVEVDQNEYLPAGGRVMDAAISVTASGAGTGPAPAAAQVIMIDCSTSMSGAKIVEAKRATGVAVDTLRDGVAFAIVAGTANATMVYPTDRRMVAATASTREQARAALRRLDAEGGTAIGVWLELAALLLDGQLADIKHGLLLTDGRNEHQTEEEFLATLQRCRGRFVCDSRGVGRGWEARPLLQIADVLLGSADGLPEPADLAEDFRSVTEALMGKTAANVTLRLWTLPDVRVRFLKQVYPRIVDLTGRGTPSGPRSVDYPTGQWGAETRDFHLSLEVPAGALNDEIRVANVSIAVGEHRSPTRPVLVRWTDDPVLPTRISARVAHYSGQVELAEVIEEGIAARAAGNVEVATAKLGRAVQLADRSGDADKLRVLDRVVEVVDAPTGTVRLRGNAMPVDVEMATVTARTTVEVRMRGQRRGETGYLPISIYLSEAGIHVEVEAAVEDLLITAGCRIDRRDDPVVGSWLRRMRARTGVAGDDLVHALETQLVHKEDAVVTSTMLHNLGPLLVALHPTKDAAIRVGAVLILKVDWVVTVHQLTVAQQLALNHRPQLATAPQEIVDVLKLAVNGSANGRAIGQTRDDGADDDHS